MRSSDEQAARDQLQAAAAAVADADGRRDRREAESESRMRLKEAESEFLLLQAVEAHIVIAALHAEVRALEDTAARARTLRSSAQTRRSDASGIDQRVASRVLPTREQIAAWRTLEEELKASPVPTSAAPSSPLMPAALAFVGALVVVATAAHLGLGWPLPTAVLAGLVAAGIVGRSGLGWTPEPRACRSPRSTNREHDAATGGRRKWSPYCVPPASRSWRITRARSRTLNARRQMHSVCVTRQTATTTTPEKQSARAAPLESRREELARLEREAPTADAVAVSTRAQAFGGDVNKVRLRIAEVQQALEATRGRLRADADAAVNAGYRPA